LRDITTISTEPETKIIYDRQPKPLFQDTDKSRVLVVGDLHCPFDLDKYLDHCKEMYHLFDCNEVVFIGDIIDNHFSSFHTTDPDGYGAGEELLRAVDRLKRWKETFPVATVILGNHDRMVMRKAFEGGIPKVWIKDYKEVLEVPNWDFVDYKEIDGVMYVHGEGGTARTRIKSDHQSLVQGHLHTQAYIDWIFNSTQRIFGMQCGTGIDFDAYSFAYAKRGKKPAVSCGVVINGLHPFLIPMTL
jgi:hypothetical protein